MSLDRDRVLKAVEVLVARGKVDAGIKELKKVLAKTGEDVNLLNRVGDLYQRLKKNEDAIKFFARTAELYEKAGFYLKAIAVQKKIQKIDPSNLTVHHRLAELNQRQGLVNDARASLQHLLNHYLRNSEWALAIGIYQKLIELEPEALIHRIKLADLYRQQKLPGKALREYADVAETLLKKHNDFDQAVQVYQRALEVDATDLAFIERAIRQLRDAGSLEASQRFLQNACHRNPAASTLWEVYEEPADPPVAESAAAGAPALPERPPNQPAPAPPRINVRQGDSSFDTAVPRAAPPAASGAEEEIDLDLEDLPSLSEIPLAETSAALDFEETVPFSTAKGQPAAAEALAGNDDQDGFEEFVIELDDETPPTLVTPPPDMLKSTGAGRAFSGPRPVTGPLPAAPPAGSLPGSSLPGTTPAPPYPPPTVTAKLVQRPFTLDDDSSELGLSFDDEQTPTAPGEGHEEAAARTIAAGLPRHDSFSNLGPRAGEPEVEAGDVFEVDLDGDEDAGLAALDVEVPRAPRYEDGPAPPSADDVGEFLAGLSLSSEAGGVAAPARAEPDLELLRRIDDLLAEAEVFVKYGLNDKAVERLEEVMAHDSTHLGAATQLVRLRLDRGEHERVRTLVNGLHEEFVSSGAIELWDELRSTLEGRGYTFAADQVVLPGEAAPTAAARGDGEPASRAAAGAPIAAGRPAKPPTPAGLVDLAALGLEIDREISDPELAAAGTPALEETALEWLEEPAASDGGAPAESAFSTEDELLDLGAELEDEGQPIEQLRPIAPEEQSVEDIVEGFKKGVSEHLSPEDSDTHYNLGIAYREMSLIDEAIGEFQIAAKNDAYLVDCCAMLGLCFREKGMPEVALKWYRKALDAAGLGDTQKLAMLYEIGQVYLESDDREAAYRTFVEIYGKDTGYRDVAVKMQELAPAS